MRDLQLVRTSRSSQLLDVDAAVKTIQPMFPDDRRRMARLVPKHPTDVALAVVMDVTVLEMSATGVLLSCDDRLGIGQRTQLQMVLDDEPFAAWIDVKRVESAPASTGDGPRFLVGAAFTSYDERSAGALQRFTRVRPPITGRMRED